jgi:hypothetical protein
MPKLIAAPGMDASSAPQWHTYEVWTGAPNPTAVAPTGGNCNDWSSKASTATAITGLNWWTLSMWFVQPNRIPGPSGYPRTCDQTGLIYCISQ